MNGIEKITGRIAQDAQAEAQRLLSQAGEEAEVIRDRRAQESQEAAEAILTEARAQAALREERMESMAALEGRKLVLAEKQAVLDEAFALALERLRSLEREKYVQLMTRLLAKASVTGQEEVIMNPTDRAQVGKEIVTGANALLAKEVAPKLPDRLADSAAGAVVSRVVSGASALAHGTGMLTLAVETRDIPGGFILADGPVEINCALNTLLDEQRAALTPEVASILF